MNFISCGAIAAILVASLLSIACWQKSFFFFLQRFRFFFLPRLVWGEVSDWSGVWLIGFARKELTAIFLVSAGNFLSGFLFCRVMQSVVGLVMVCFGVAAAVVDCHGPWLLLLLQLSLLIQYHAWLRVHKLEDPFTCLYISIMLVYPCILFDCCLQIPTESFNIFLCILIFSCHCPSSIGVTPWWLLAVWWLLLLPSACWLLSQWKGLTF